MMSCLAKSQYKYLSCDAKERYCLMDNDEDDNDFDFQYVPVKEFKHIVRDVKRQRNKNKEQVIWTTFLKEQERSSLNQRNTDGSKYKSTRTLAESLEEVDRELMRLENDALLDPHFKTGSIAAKDYEEKHLAKSLQKDSPPTRENGTGSANLLLTIPEEEHDHYGARSSDSRKPHCTYIRKCSSAHNLKSDRVQCRCYHYGSDLDYHSSPDRFSNDDDDDSIPVHPDPVAVTKILDIQRKISIVLDSISFELDRIPLPDGENDLLRRQQRVVEFSTRLSRNYLYDLSRQISDIQRHIKATASDSRVRLSRRAVITHMQAIEQKLISAHQLLLTALSAYWKHIPSSVMKNHPGKLKNILQVVVQLKNICLDIQLTSDIYCSGDDKDTFLGKETESRCNAILSKFRPHSDNESQMHSHSAKSTIGTPTRIAKKRNRKTIANRLGMYAMDVRLAKAYLPKRTQSMFQFPRDRKNNFQMKQPGNTLSRRSNALSAAKSSCEALGAKTAKINVPPKEDDIQTMMESVQQDLDAESLGSMKLGRKSEIFNKQSCQSIHESQKLKKGGTRNAREIKRGGEGDEGVSSLLPVIEDLLSLVKNNPSTSKTMPKNSIEMIHEYLQLCQPVAKPSECYSNEADHELVTGEKNMRLISYYTGKDNKNGKLTGFQSNNDFTKFNDASCQANYSRSIGTFELSVSESARSCLTDYQKEYQRSLKSNSMYASSTRNKPWEIVSWIADKLVDELIVKLADDFQIDDVIQKLFELEFQER